MTRKLLEGIFKRGNVDAVRFSVPTAVQSVVGKKEIVRSLGTKDLGEAPSKRQEALDEIRKIQFSDYKDRPNVRPKSNYGSIVRETAHRWLSESDGIGEHPQTEMRGCGIGYQSPGVVY